MRRTRNTGKILAEFFEFEAYSATAAHNGEREKKEYEEEEDIIMSKVEAKEFRGMVARLNYMSQDSPDIQYPAKELSKEMANPKISGWRRLKKTVRYLLGREAVVWRYAWQDEVDNLVGKTDSDWGETRRSEVYLRGVLDVRSALH